MTDAANVEWEIKGTTLFVGDQTVDLSKTDGVWSRAGRLYIKERGKGAKPVTVSVPMPESAEQKAALNGSPLSRFTKQLIIV